MYVDLPQYVPVSGVVGEFSRGRERLRNGNAKVRVLALHITDVTGGVEGESTNYYHKIRNTGKNAISTLQRVEDTWAHTRLLQAPRSGIDLKKGSLKAQKVEAPNARH